MNEIFARGEKLQPDHPGKSPGLPRRRPIPKQRMPSQETVQGLQRPRRNTPTVSSAT